MLCYCPHWLNNFHHHFVFHMMIGLCFVNKLRKHINLLVFFHNNVFMLGHYIIHKIWYLTLSSQFCSAEIFVLITFFEKPFTLWIPRSYIYVLLLPQKKIVVILLFYLFCNAISINVTEQPEKYTLNNQTSIKNYLMKMYIYVFGCWQSIQRTDIYGLCCWYENLLVACQTVRGRIYTYLDAEVQVG